MGKVGRPKKTKHHGQFGLLRTSETILSPRRRRKKKSSVSDRELKSMANQLFPTDRLKNDDSSFRIEDDSGNRILPYRELKECLESNVVCKKCHSRLSERVQMQLLRPNNFPNPPTKEFSGEQDNQER